jgi:hypothetical protein
MWSAIPIAKDGDAAASGDDDGGSEGQLRETEVDLVVTDFVEVRHKIMCPHCSPSRAGPGVSFILINGDYEPTSMVCRLPLAFSRVG